MKIGSSQAGAGTPGHDGLAADRWYVLFLMTCVYAMNIADRFVVSTLVEPIKAAFSLSDASVGLLTGTALAIFYVTAGIPLGMLADRANRKRMVVAALGLWSLLTMACGLSTTFWQLFLARIGVGVGEAGGTPPSQSLLSDKFPPRQRGFAMSIYAVGASAGAALGASLGGYLSDHYGWRAVLIVFGAIGLPLALLVMVSMREPRRGALDAAAADRPAGLMQTLRFIAGQKSLIHVLIGATVVTFWGWGLVWWTPAFLVRSHGMTVGQSGAVLGLMHGVGGSLVTLATAWIFALLANRRAQHQVWFVAAATVLPTIPSIIAYAAHSTALATVMLWLFVPMIYLYLGPTLALVQNLAPANMRAQVVAILLFVANVANLVIAPSLVGFASDRLAPYLADPKQSLRYVLIATALTGFWGAWHYFAAARRLTQDLITAGSETSSSVT